MLAIKLKSNTLERDIILTRKILRDIEASHGVETSSLSYPGKTRDEVMHYLQMLVDYDLIEAVDTSSKDVFDTGTVRLTNEGRQFLDTYRKDFF